jgi:hypothetical protein
MALDNGHYTPYTQQLQSGTGCFCHTLRIVVGLLQPCGCAHLVNIYYTDNLLDPSATP